MIYSQSIACRGIFSTKRPPLGHVGAIRGRTKVNGMIADIQISSADDRFLTYSNFLAVSRAGREYGGYLFDVIYPPLAEYLEKPVHLYVNDARALTAWITKRGYYLTQWASREQVLFLQQLFPSFCRHSQMVDNPRKISDESRWSWGWAGKIVWEK